MNHNLSPNADGNSLSQFGGGFNVNNGMVYGGPDTHWGSSQYGFTGQGRNGSSSMRETAFLTTPDRRMTPSPYLGAVQSPVPGMDVPYQYSTSSNRQNLDNALDPHKDFLSANPEFAREIEERVEAIKEFRRVQEMNLRTFDERMSSLTEAAKQKLSQLRGGGANNISVKKLPNGVLVEFFARPLGFIADWTQNPPRVAQTFKPELTQAGVTVGSCINSIDDSIPSEDALRNVETPFTIHFSSIHQIPPKPQNAADMRTSSRIALKKSLSPQQIRVCTPEKRTKERPDVELLKLDPKMPLEHFNHQELGKIYGRCYGEYLDQQTLPWSQDLADDRQSLKTLMSRIRMLLEKYQAALREAVKKRHEESNSDGPQSSGSRSRLTRSRSRDHSLDKPVRKVESERRI